MGEGRCEEVLSRTQNELGGKGTDFLAASAPSPGFLPWYPVPRVVYAQSACCSLGRPLCCFRAGEAGDFSTGSKGF